MKHRGGSVRQGIPRGRKSQSCEDVSTQGRSAVSQTVVNSDHGSEPISTSRGSDVHPTVLSQPDSGTSTASQPVAVKESSSCHDCPVEVQTHQLLDAQEKERRIRRMYTEFKAKRKVVLSGLPPSCNTESLNCFLKDYSCIAVSKVKDCSVRLLFPDAERARVGLALLNSARFDSHKLTATYGHPDSLLFVGNLPYTFTSKELAQLFQLYGEILRCLVVCSPESGLSKGYGFVEFVCREEATIAKQQMATKVVGMRSLRVDFADNGMQTCEDLQSQTLFVDRLPKGFKDDGALRRLFRKCGTVNFCQVALTAPFGSSRGFAFVDMSSAEEAEHAQQKCNGVTFAGQQEIRVSFGMPCRPGACILQHRNSVPFNPAGKLNGPPPPGLKENFPFMPVVRGPCRIFPTMFIPGQYGCPKSLTITSLPTPVILSEQRVNTLAAGLNPPVSLPSSLPQSMSAPTVITLHHHAKITTDKTSNRHTPTDVDGNEASSCRKRRAPIDTDELSVEPDNLIGVYDKPYIGQHQQGIPYTHPLKRIRMEN